MLMLSPNLKQLDLFSQHSLTFPLKTSFTIEELLDFILLNKHNNVFIGWNPGQILAAIYKHLEDNTILYYADEGKIKGCIFWHYKQDPFGNTYAYIDDFLSLRGDSISFFLSVSRDIIKQNNIKYLVGCRNGKFIKYEFRQSSVSGKPQLSSSPYTGL